MARESSAVLWLSFMGMKKVQKSVEKDALLVIEREKIALKKGEL
jgi:hypothetical protein